MTEVIGIAFIILMAILALALVTEDIHKLIHKEEEEDNKK